MNASLRLSCGSANPRDRGLVGRLTGSEWLALAHTLRFSIGDGINGRSRRRTAVTAVKRRGRSCPKKALAAARCADAGGRPAVYPDCAWTAPVPAFNAVM